MTGLLSCDVQQPDRDVGQQPEARPTLTHPVNSEKPNIIIILADDIGAETVGAYGSEYQTPRIDSIAANGIRFDAAHATPICTPSRVRLLTGRYNYKNYVDFAVLDPAEDTIAQRLEQAGYRTLVSGKWQLSGTGDEGDPTGTLPRDAGFAEQLVWYLDRATKGSRYWGPRLFDGQNPVQHEDSEYGPTIVNQRVVDFIERDDEQPFFIYYSMMLAHKAWVTTPISLDAESDKDRFRGMMSYMDLMVGNVLDALAASSKANNTLVFFIGDNGTHPDITSLRNGVPVQGGKWNSNYRGTLVPFAAQWPAVIPAGAESTQLVDLMDVMPTALQAAGESIPGILDGYSLMPEMTDKAGSGRQWIFMHFDPHQDQDESLTSPSRFVFDGKWKLYSDARTYDLRNDAEELVQIDTSTLSVGDEANYRKLLGVMQQHGQRPFFSELAEQTKENK